MYSFLSKSVTPRCYSQTPSKDSKLKIGSGESHPHHAFNSPMCRSSHDAPEFHTCLLIISSPILSSRCITQDWRQQSFVVHSAVLANIAAQAFGPSGVALVQVITSLVSLMSMAWGNSTGISTRNFLWCCWTLSLVSITGWEASKLDS